MKLGKMLYAIDNDIYEELLLQEKKEIAKKNANIYIKKEYKQLLKWLKKEIKKGYVPYISLEEIDKLVNDYDNNTELKNKIMDNKILECISRTEILKFKNNIILNDKLLNIILLNIIFNNENVFSCYIKAEEELKSISEDYKLDKYIDIIEKFQSNNIKNVEICKEVENNKKIRK